MRPVLLADNLAQTWGKADQMRGAFLIGNADGNILSGHVDFAVFDYLTEAQRALAAQFDEPNFVDHRVVKVPVVRPVPVSEENPQAEWQIVHLQEYKHTQFRKPIWCGFYEGRWYVLKAKGG